MTTVQRNENDVVIPSNIPVTPDTHEAEATETETSSPRTFLPNGPPSRPTATATCQPRLRYNAFWKDKSTNLSERIHIHQKVVKPLF